LAVLGVLIVCTIVSLFIVPVFFTLVEDMQRALNRRYVRWFPPNQVEKKLPVEPLVQP
jgi:hypothetical protein